MSTVRILSFVCFSSLEVVVSLNLKVGILSNLENALPFFFTFCFLLFSVFSPPGNLSRVVRAVYQPPYF